jgi:hypothetical protein
MIYNSNGTRGPEGCVQVNVERRRRPRLIPGLCGVLAGALASVWVASHYRQIVWHSRPHSELRRLSVYFARGVCEVDWSVPLPPAEIRGDLRESVKRLGAFAIGTYIVPTTSGVIDDPAGWTVRRHPVPDQQHGLRWENASFVSIGPQQTYWVRVPCWSILMLAAVWPLGDVLRGPLRRRRRRHRGECEQCGYSLRGNVSGVCPECGTAAAAAP